MNRRFVSPLIAALVSVAALAPLTVCNLDRPAQAAPSEPIGAVAMMAGKTIKGTVPYGERTFRPTDRTLSCIVVFANPSAGTRVKTEWYAINAGGMKNVKFNEDELTMNAEDNARLFIFTLNKPWPTGKYQVKIFRDGKFDRTIAFNIK